MRTTNKIFVKRNKAAGHEETVLHIDWEGVSPEDIRMFAERYILHSCEHSLKFEEKKLPESVTVYAADYVNNTPAKDCRLNLPEKGPKKSKAVRELEEALAGMTKEELEVLFGSI